jgi:hypothetical protein
MSDKSEKDANLAFARRDCETPRNITVDGSAEIIFERDPSQERCCSSIAFSDIILK